MKRKICRTNILFLIIHFCIISVIYSQTDVKIDFSQNLVDDVICNPYIEGDFTRTLIEYDLSHFWISDSVSSEFGIIGNDFYKIQIHIHKVIRDINNKTEYFVYGKSKVRDNICVFNGTIKLIKAVTYKKSIGETIISGNLVADYIFYEDKNQRNTGYFKGKLSTDWHLDTLNNRIFIENGSHSSDGFMNNSFVGIWKSYKTGNEKKCIWGISRLPYTDDFDIGTAEIYVNPKYVKNGWESLNTRDRSTWPVRHYDKSKWWIKR